MPFRLDLKRGREGSKGLLWNTRTNHGQAQERRVCVISGTSHGTLPLRWADQTLWRRAAKSCAHPAAHRAPSWRASRVLEEKSSRSILATGPRPRRKLSDDLKRLDTPTSPRRGPSSFTSLAQATMTTLRTATWRDTMRRKCGRRSYARSGPKSPTALLTLSAMNTRVFQTVKRPT